MLKYMFLMPLFMKQISKVQGCWVNSLKKDKKRVEIEKREKIRKERKTKETTK
jgi:hypothetical protein